MPYYDLIAVLERVAESCPTAVVFIIEQFIWNLRKNVLKEFRLEQRTLGLLDKLSGQGNEVLLRNAEEIFEINRKMEVRDGGV